MNNWQRDLRLLLGRLPPDWLDLQLDHLLERLRLDLHGDRLDDDLLRLAIELMDVLRDMLESELARRQAGNGA